MSLERLEAVLVLVFPVLWMLVSVPGLIIWWRNARTARATLLAAKAQGIDNGRLQWARYNSQKTRTHVIIESIFVLAGLTLFLSILGVFSILAARLINAPLLTICAALLTLLAYRWRRIDDDLVEAAARRNAEQDKLIAQAAAQDARGAEQNARDAEQDARDEQTQSGSVVRDARDTAQDARGAEQDARGVEQTRRSNAQDTRSAEQDAKDEADYLSPPGS